MGWKQQGERPSGLNPGDRYSSGDNDEVGYARSFQVSARGEVTVTLPPRLELHCPTLVVANQSLELTLVSWGSVGVDVEWKITKDGVEVAKGKILEASDFHL